MPVSTKGQSNRQSTKARGNQSAATAPPTLFRLPDLGEPVSKSAAAPAGPNAFAQIDSRSDETTDLRVDDSANAQLSSANFRNQAATGPTSPDVDGASKQDHITPSEFPDTATRPGPTPATAADVTPEIRMYDNAEEAVAKPTMESHGEHNSPHSRSLFDRIGSQSLVLVALVTIAGAAMLANRNRNSVPQNPVIEQQSRPLVGSDWPENHSATPATVATDQRADPSVQDPENSTQPAALGTYDPTDKAYANPAPQRKPSDSIPVSQSTGATDNLQLGSYRQHSDAPELADTHHPANNIAPAATNVPSGSYEQPGPSEIPVHGVTVTPMLTAPPAAPDLVGDLSSSAPVSANHPLAANKPIINDEPDDALALHANIDPSLESDSAALSLGDPQSAISGAGKEPTTSSNELQFNAPGQTSAATISLRPPSATPQLRYTSSPDAIDWSRYLPTTTQDQPSVDASPQTNAAPTIQSTVVPASYPAQGPPMNVPPMTNGASQTQLPNVAQPGDVQPAYAQPGFERNNFAPPSYAQPNTQPRTPMQTSSPASIVFTP